MAKLKTNLQTDSVPPSLLRQDEDYTTTAAQPKEHRILFEVGQMSMGAEEIG